MSASASQRLFFALEPDANTRAGLAQLARQLHVDIAVTSRRVPTQNLHLTLAFLGEVTPTQRDALAAWLADFQAPRFTFSVDRVERFARADVVWAGPGRPPDALTTLAAVLRDQAVDLGIVTSKAREWAFKPHVSLLRSVRSVPPESLNSLAIVGMLPLSWRVEQCVLLASQPLRGGVRYVRVAASRVAVE